MNTNEYHGVPAWTDDRTVSVPWHAVPDGHEGKAPGRWGRDVSGLRPRRRAICSS